MNADTEAVWGSIYHSIHQEHQRSHDEQYPQWGPGAQEFCSKLSCSHCIAQDPRKSTTLSILSKEVEEECRRIALKGCSDCASYQGVTKRIMEWECLVCRRTLEINEKGENAKLPWGFWVKASTASASGSGRQLKYSTLKVDGSIGKQICLTGNPCSLGADWTPLDAEATHWHLFNVSRTSP